MIKGIEHFGIAAENSTALKDWYIDIFGLKIKTDNGKGGYFLEDANGVQIEIYPADKTIDRDYNNFTAGTRHVAFLVENFEEEYARLKEKNVNFLGEPIIKEKYSNLFFKDPEGNIVHIVERR